MATRTNTQRGQKGQQIGRTHLRLLGPEIERESWIIYRQLTGPNLKRLAGFMGLPSESRISHRRTDERNAATEILEIAAGRAAHGDDWPEVELAILGLMNAAKRFWRGTEPGCVHQLALVEEESDGRDGPAVLRYLQALRVEEETGERVPAAIEDAAIAALSDQAADSLKLREAIKWRRWQRRAA